MASRGVQAPSAVEKKAMTSEQVREAYHQRLDTHIKQAIDCYRSIIASCKIQDRVSGLRGDFQSQVDTSNLCKAAEDILRLITELKVASIVQEITDSKQESHELRLVYDTEVKATEKAIGNLSEHILPMLEQLEAHYYVSCTTWTKPTVSSADEQAQQQNKMGMDIGGGGGGGGSGAGGGGGGVMDMQP